MSASEKRQDEGFFERDLARLLTTRFLGRRVVFRNSIDSTNRLGLELLSDGAPAGTLVWAEEQTAGRGRMNRHWWSPYGLGATFSVLLDPRVPPGDLPYLSLLTAVSLCETLRTDFDLDAGIAWPNDLVVRAARRSWRKVAGILLENGNRFGLVAGIGINVNQEAGDFPGDLRTSATSLRIELGVELDRLDVVGNFLNRFEPDLVRFSREGAGVRWRELNDWNALAEESVRVRLGSRTVEGQVVAIDREGALGIRVADGTVRWLHSGEVARLEPPGRKERES